MNIQEELELNVLFEAMPTSPAEKKVAVVIGRFNPPTKGHYKVINEVKKFIRENKNLKLEAGPMVVVIGGSKSDSDTKRNPLSVEDRIRFMQGSGNANGAIFISAKNAFEAFSSLREKGYEPIAIAAGSDRATDYLRILDKYFLNADGSAIEHHVINLDRDEGAVETKAEEKKTAMDKALDQLKERGKIDTGMISGSLARRAVELGYEEEFAEITGLRDKPELAKQMFKKVKVAIEG